MRDGMVVRSGGGARRTRATTTKQMRGGSDWSRRLLTAAMRHPGAVLTGGLFAVALAAVSVNALTLQTAPHPAPLFSDRGEQSRAVQSSQMPEREAGRSQGASQGIQTTQPQQLHDTRPAQSAAREAPPSLPPAIDRSADAPRSIGDLLAAPVPPTRPDGSAATATNNGSRSTQGSIASLLADDDGPTRTGSTAPASPDDSVASAQRALEEIGYGPLTADGLYGPMTREAIERFESDHGLTVTGKLVPATAQALARESGIAID